MCFYKIYKSISGAFIIVYTVFLFTYLQLLASVSCFCSYDAGTLAHIWPLGHVTLSLHGPFLTNVTLAGAMIDDVSYPETPIILKDIHLIGVQSVQPFSKAAKRRIRYGHFTSTWVKLIL